MKYFPKDKEELIALVADESIKLDEIDVSKITDMSFLFCQVDLSECKNSAKKRKNFKGIEKWNTSNVENMKGMFYGNESFNEPIGDWDVSNVKDMSNMFDEAKAFNQPLDRWNVSNVENMSYMFYNAISFNQPLNSWNVSRVKNMWYMFYKATSFNQPLDKWNVSNVEDVYHMFSKAESFNPQSIKNWDLRKARNVDYMF
ncbi:hypothetical protein CQA57_03660 [Helicobacter anseris]|uniref:BspA family leucine-rich repeat surface protein n=1 Tax=Helicobacter anseris TaxID=375926 RepID=A0A3D8J9Y5_9HELI|nr:hypothetical protein CQA57_03660 [Helicobacter anseris]